MLVSINEIKVNPGRRDAALEDIKSLADSIAELGLLNPITIDQGHTLIAGRHRMEAAKLLGWTKIECTVTDLQGLQAELAEIDENFVRKNLSIIDFGNLLLRRKEIYEILHPKTKQGTGIRDRPAYPKELRGYVQGADFRGAIRHLFGIPGE